MFKKLMIVTLVMAFIQGNVLAAGAIAVVDIEKVISEAPQTQSYKSKMKAEFTPKRSQLIAEEQKLKQLQAEKQKESSFMSQEQLKKEADAFRDKLKQFYIKRGKFNQMVEERAQENQKKLFEQLTAIFKRLQAERQYQLIIPKDVVLANDPRLEITSDVLAILKREFSKSGQ